MEQNHFDILRMTLKLQSSKLIHKVDKFIEANQDTSIAILIRDKKCDFYIFGLSTPLCEHLMAYIIADSVIRHKAGDTYLNNCINALLARVKTTKLYVKNNAVFTNVRNLIQECLIAYNGSNKLN